MRCRISGSTKLGHVTPNHLTGIEPESVVANDERDQVRGRAVVAMKLKPVPVEAVVRGYLIGSGWKDYQRSGGVCGIELPPGLQMASRLPEPIFTPANKAELGTHDENISFERMQEVIGAELAFQMRSISLALYPQRPNTPPRAASSSPTPNSSSASTLQATCA